jgi:methyl-accepting chemotaxis protein
MRLKLVHKLLGGFFTNVILITVVAAISILMLSEIDTAHHVVEDRSDLSAFLMKAEIQHLDFMDQMDQLFLSGKTIDSLKGHTECDFGKWYASFQPYHSEIEAIHASIAKPHEEIHKSAAEALALYKAGQTDEAKEIYQNSTLPAVSQVRQSLNRLADTLDKDVSDAKALASQSSNRARSTLLLGSLLALIVASGLGFLLTRSIVNGVTQVARAADGLAQGDVEQTVKVKEGDEIGQMAKSFSNMISYLREMAQIAEAVSNGDLTKSATPRSDRDVLGIAFQRMIANLREMVGHVSFSASSLAAASQQVSAASEQAGSATSQIAATIQQVAHGNQDQSTAVQETTASVDQLSKAIDQITKGAEEQARSIQKASVSVAQLNDSINQVANASKEVSNATQKAFEAASSGAQSVRKSTQGMDSIKARTNDVATKIQELGSYSNQIGSIVETIDDIAEQTNLLALNAAIEAARAGEHGRGFAVVADEVRKLAERSSKSTKEIANLINQVQRGTQEAVSAMDQGTREVEAGSQLAQEAGVALNNILSAVQAAANQVSHITSAVQQMEGASKQVIDLMDSVSSIVEESAAASRQMAASSQQLAGTFEKVAAVSEETSAAAEEVSASTEEMSAQVEQMMAQAQSLAKMADELQAAVGKFRIAEDNGHDITFRRRKSDWTSLDTYNMSRQPRPLEKAFQDHHD